MRQPWRSHWVGLVVAVLLAAACDSDEPAAQDAAFDSGATVERDGAEVSLPADRSHDLGTEVGLTSDADTASAPDVDAAPIADVRSPPSDVGGGFDADTADVAPVDADAATTDLLASITSLSIFPKDATLEGGESRTFVLTATLADGTTRVVTALATWTSSNPAAASIAHDPLAPSVATGVTPGRTTITAALDGHKATHELEVRGLSLVNLAIRGFSPTLARTSGRLTAWGTFIGGNPERIVERDISPFVRWHSTVPEAFEVSNTPGFAGRVTAMINGLQAQITASLGDLRAEREAFTGSGHGFTFVALPGTATLPLGARMRFHMLWVFPTNLPGVVPASWTSSDPTVAAFDDQHEGVLVAKKPGDVTITGAINFNSVTARIKITSANLTSLVVTPAQSTIPQGMSVRIAAMGKSSDGSTIDLTEFVSWSSSEPAVLTIDKPPFGRDFNAKSTGFGTTRVTASYAGLGAEAVVSVTTAKLVRLTITPATARVPRWVSQRFVATGTFNDGTVHDLSGDVTWACSASCTATGVATITQHGRWPITATYGGFSAEASLEVVESELESLKVDPPVATIPVGGFVQLKAEATFIDARKERLTVDVTNDASWMPWGWDNLLEVGNMPLPFAGRIRGLAVGKAKVSASFIEATPSEITVVPASSPASP